MKKQVLVTLVVITIAGFSLQPNVNAATYSLDSAHSSTIFKVKHFDIGYIYGMFLEQSGMISYDPQKPAKTSINLSFKTNSIFTNVRKRDNHLKGPDFFNAKQFPTITFESTSVEPISDTTLKVTGNLTMHGVTNTVSTIVKLTGSGEGPQGNFRRGFWTKFTINRLDYNVDYMPDAISSKIQIIASGEVIQK